MVFDQYRPPPASFSFILPTSKPQHPPGPALNGGYKNMCSILQLSSPADDVPAAKWCMDKGYAWYLPSDIELVNIGRNKDIINSIFDKNGRTKLATASYCTSTILENAVEQCKNVFVIVFRDSDYYWGSGIVTQANQVRAVRIL